MKSKSGIFPALLKHHRARRGLSQLELALEADVSARHVSFLESGRAQPSAAMVVRLLTALGASLREQNEALHAADLESLFPELPAGGLPVEVQTAIDQMMRQHEPFPLSLLALDGTVVAANRGARRLFEIFAADARALIPAVNIFTLFFDPRLWRSFVLDWEDVACGLIARLHRESLTRSDARLPALIERLLAFPEVPAAWRRPVFSTSSGPLATFRLQRGDLKLAFLIAITTFSGPRDVTLDELRIESCFPADEATRTTCARLAGPS